MRRWLFSPQIDLTLFLGTALFSACTAFFLAGELSPLAWFILVVGIDVAHVWSSLFKVYLDPVEMKRRPLLYWAAPAGALGVSVVLYSIDESWFWTAMAYMAAWHFTKQQVGFFALYANLSAHSKTTKTLGLIAIYCATLGPLVWWHAHLPLNFWWMKEHDFFIKIPKYFGSIGLAICALSSVSYFIFSLVKRELHWGQLALLLATLIAWIGGIVYSTSDATFTAMNVMLHGVPYGYLVYRYARSRANEPDFVLGSALLKFGFVLFVLFLWVLAYAEEFLWDLLVWHDHPEWFSVNGFELSPALLTLIVPLLALPQTTHYVLDGFIWKGQQNPDNARRIFG